MPKPNAASDVPVGSIWYEEGGRVRRPARVMATAEGYVLARFSRCYPFVSAHKDWRKHFTRVVNLAEWQAMTAPNGEAPSVLQKGDETP